jgi:hypothetical protein
LTDYFAPATQLLAEGGTIDEVFAWLQQYYGEQRDGEWENHMGITIATLDSSLHVHRAT